MKNRAGPKTRWDARIISEERSATIFNSRSRSMCVYFIHVRAHVGPIVVDFRWTLEKYTAHNLEKKKTIAAIERNPKKKNRVKEIFLSRIAYPRNFLSTCDNVRREKIDRDFTLSRGWLSRQKKKKRVRHSTYRMEKLFGEILFQYCSRNVKWILFIFRKLKQECSRLLCCVSATESSRCFASV